MYRLYRGGYHGGPRKVPVHAHRADRRVPLDTPFYCDPAMEMKDVQIAGVSDPDAARAAPYAAKAGCPTFTDYREMCARLKPDFAFALGRHCDMAEEARFLIDNIIPFAMEKPCALNA